MLVLSRRRDQAIMIGDEVEITIVDIRGDKVRVGIRAPETITVHRREIFDQIKAENLEASAVQPPDLAGLAVPNIVSASPNANGVEKRVTPAPAYSQVAADPFLSAAIQEATTSLSEGGLPIGSVLVRGAEIIGRGHDRTVQTHDPMAHAEIACLTSAGLQGTYKDTILYTTTMPCHLCSGAVVQLGISTVIVGNSANAQVEGKADESSAFMRSHHVKVIELNSASALRR